MEREAWENDFSRKSKKYRAKYFDAFYELYKNDNKDDYDALGDTLDLGIPTPKGQD
jgi:hypothetical protein